MLYDPEIRANTKYILIYNTATESHKVLALQSDVDLEMYLSGINADPMRDVVAIFKAEDVTKTHIKL